MAELAIHANQNGRAREVTGFRYMTTPVQGALNSIVARIPRERAIPK